MDNERNFGTPDLGFGTNSPNMCDQCICMLCNKGPDMYKSCDKCMTCMGPVRICPKKDFDKKE